MTAVLPRDEIAFHPASTGRDADGRLFEWRGDLYRGVAAENVEGYRALLGSEVFRRLVEAGALAPTEATELELDGYGLVVRHERLEFVSYPFEWSWPMLRDAGLALLDANRELVAGGYLTKDPSSWNVLFDATRPVYVDFANIWALDRAAYALTTWPEWFRSYYTYPLRLVGEGKARVVRRLLRDYEVGIVRDEMLELGLHLRGRAEREARRVARGVRRRVQTHLPRAGHSSAGASPSPLYYPPERWQELLSTLREELAAVEVPVPVTKWSRYYDLSLSPAAPVEGLSAKHLNVARVLDELRPATVVDIGASTGWFSKLAAEKGARVVVLEADESAVARLYADAKAASLSILPLVMDITRPSPAYGLAGTRVASAAERFRGDLVMALALVHHLVLKQGLDFDHVVASLGAFARSRLLVEWVDPTDPALLSVYPQPVEWYTLERFTRALEREFVVRDVLDSHPETRKLILCERR